MDPAVEAFGDVAGEYERARPSYPAEAVALLGVGTGVRVCDLAAGTGKLTRLLVATGADVVAVEPVEGMRAELTRAAPDVDVVNGTAEAIPLDEGSVDLLTVAQAFHWFDFEPALAEIGRVLRPGGRLAILFNERDERTSWVKEWNARIEWHSRRIAYYQDTDWTAVLEAAGYGDVRDQHIEWVQPMTRELMAARVRSVSYVAAEPADVQQDYVDRVLALVDGFDEPFDLPYVTHVWMATRP